MRRKILITALMSSFVLGACGVKGSLKTPPPLWGEKAKEDYRKKQQQEEQKKEGEDQQDDSTPDT